MGEFLQISGVTVYRAEPVDEPKAALILIHEIWGLVAHIQDIADRFAGEGYLVLAPDLLTEVGITPEVGLELNELRKEPDEAKRLAAQPLLRERLAPARSAEFAESAVRRLKLLVDELAQDPRVADRIAVTGFCFGGTYSFALAAADVRVRAAVPFYGRAPEPDQIAAITIPVLALYGENDPPLMEVLPEVVAEFERVNPRFEHKVYPDAGHAFFNDTNPNAYVPEVARDAWQRTLAFLEQTLGDS